MSTTTSKGTGNTTEAGGQEIRRLNNRIRVLNGTVDNWERENAGKMRIITALMAERDALKASNAALVEALTKFATAAKSWHETHGHGVNPIQCDWLCECIAPGEAALSRARGEP